MKAEIISIGTELLMGEIVDTNAAYIASRLPALGAELLWVSQVGDNPGRMDEVFLRAWGRSDLIFTTGGLGPTDDDLTRETIARVLGEEMKVDEGLLRELKAFFGSRGYAMPQSNTKQATLIPSARAIPNPRGTAPGWWVERDGRVLIVMPGPPAEMQRMWEKEVEAELKARAKGGIIISRTLKTFGQGEAAVGEAVRPYFASENPFLGIYSRPDGIQVRIAARADSEAKAWRLIGPVEDGIRAALGPIIWGVDGQTIEERVGELLAAKGLTLACMESCTGGLLATTITEVPGSSAYFKGGVVTYSNDMKIANGVPSELIEAHGAVSPQVAEAMAEAARRLLKADVGVGITGVAGPDPMEGKPVGTVHIGLVHPWGGKVISSTYPPQRPMVRRRAVTAVLFELWRILQASS